MITNLVLRKKELSVVTQQYTVGLYVAVYHQGKSMPDQMAFQDVTEEQFHRDVRAGKFFRGRVKVNAESSSPIK